MKGSITHNKAPGPDGIPLDLFWADLEFWGPLLTLVLNAACRAEVMPSWSTAVIVLVFKKGDKNYPKCYRPISLIDVVVKVLGG